MLQLVLGAGCYLLYYLNGVHTESQWIGLPYLGLRCCALASSFYCPIGYKRKTMDNARFLDYFEAILSDLQAKAAGKGLTISDETLEKMAFKRLE